MTQNYISWVFFRFVSTLFFWAILIHFTSVSMVGFPSNSPWSGRFFGSGDWWLSARTVSVETWFHSPEGFVRFNWLMDRKVTGFTSCRLVWSGGVGGMRLAGADAAAAGRHVGGCEPTGISHHRWQREWAALQTAGRRLPSIWLHRCSSSLPGKPDKKQEGHEWKGETSVHWPS